jgi:ribosomal-protein-alanine N-acetyltransferase
VIELRTPRLHLIAATLELARAEVSDRSMLARLLDARLPSDWPPPLNDDDSARFFLDYLTKHPADAGWMAWYFVAVEDCERVAIGNGGFKGVPSDGAVEIGYSVVPRYQRRGFAGEAVRALVAWAFSHADVDRVVAQTLPELRASQALLRSLGFREAAALEAGTLRFELRNRSRD